MDWLEAKAIVQKAHPSADSASKHTGYVVRSHCGLGADIIGEGDTNQDAWINAANAVRARQDIHEGKQVSNPSVVAEAAVLAAFPEAFCQRVNDDHYIWSGPGLHQILLATDEDEDVAWFKAAKEVAARQPMQADIDKVRRVYPDAFVSEMFGVVEIGDCDRPGCNVIGRGSTEAEAWSSAAANIKPGDAYNQSTGWYVVPAADELFSVWGALPCGNHGRIANGIPTQELAERIAGLPQMRANFDAVRKIVDTAKSGLSSLGL